MNLEDQLRAALRREPAPADFAARILSKTQLAKTGPPFRPRPWTLATAAASRLRPLYRLRCMSIAGSSAPLPRETN